jgi:tRNA pseudouridine32 synthase/23S rRNA pseudouridine746 synthase
MADIGLLHVDDSLIVVVKPAGLLAVPGRGEQRRDCLAARVQALHADALTVHRLDMATSGLMVFARGAAMQRALSAAFAERQVDKRYEAVVEGVMAQDAGSIDAPLAADWPRRPRQKVDALQGRPSLTHWQVLQRGADWTRLALQPVTGRSHQLRVHLLSIGHPIRGDALYAPCETDAGAASTRQEPLDRLLLHATRLALRHPVTGAALCFESAAPF